MSDNPTPEEVRASIVPKSDQLNADDLVTGAITATISKVKRGDREQPIVVEIEGHRPYKPCKTMRRVLIAVFGDDPKDWVGQRLTLYCDPDVTWAGVKVGGIRISHLSGLAEPKTFVIAKTRGKREERTIYPVATLSPEEASTIAEYKEEIANADTAETLKAIGFLLKNQQSQQVKDAVRVMYGERLEQLRGQKAKSGKGSRATKTD